VDGTCRPLFWISGRFGYPKQRGFSTRCKKTAFVPAVLVKIAVYRTWPSGQRGALLKRAEGRKFESQQWQ
jgi:hypothetical protein